MPENQENEQHLVLKTEKLNVNNCTRCGKEFKKRLLIFNIHKNCFICGKTVCSDCLTKEERLDPYTGKKGYSCLDCYPQTKVASSSSLLTGLSNVPGVIDINSAVESIDEKIPEKLDNINASLNEIISVDNTLKELISLIKEEVEDVKSFSQGFTQKNWQIIQKDIYKILIFSGIGIIVLSCILTLQILYFIKYIYPII